MSWTGPELCVSEAPVLINGEYGDGAYGPTILLELLSVEATDLLLSLLDDLVGPRHGDPTGSAPRSLAGRLDNAARTAGRRRLAGPSPGPRRRGRIRVELYGGRVADSAAARRGPFEANLDTSS